MFWSVITVIVLLLVVFPLGAYAYWIWRAAKSKRWKIVAWQVVAPLAGLLAIKAGLFWQNLREEARYWEDIFSVRVAIGEPVFKYHSTRAFNGDGYSIEVFTLPDPVLKRFLAPDRLLTTEFPKRPDYRDHWNAHAWSQAPFDSKLQEYLEFAEMGGRGLPGVDAQIGKIREALKYTTTYYAFFYNRPTDHVGDVDFFIVDLKAGLFYAINFNT